MLPGTESALLALSEAPDSLPPGVVSGAPPATVVVRATDKLELAALAERAGFGTPPTTIVDAGERPEDVTYPAVVKPVRSEVELPGGGRARSLVARVASADEAEAALRAMPAGRALIQPFLSGPVVTANGAAWHGETLATVHQRRSTCGRRTAACWPPPAPWRPTHGSTPPSAG